MVDIKPGITLRVLRPNDNGIMEWSEWITIGEVPADITQDEKEFLKSVKNLEASGLIEIMKSA